MFHEYPTQRMTDVERAAALEDFREYERERRRQPEPRAFEDWSRREQDEHVADQYRRWSGDRAEAMIVRRQQVRREEEHFGLTSGFANSNGFGISDAYRVGNEVRYNSLIPYANAIAQHLPPASLRAPEQAQVSIAPPIAPRSRGRPPRNAARRPAPPAPSQHQVPAPMPAPLPAPVPATNPVLHLNNPVLLTTATVWYKNHMYYVMFLPGNFSDGITNYSVRDQYVHEPLPYEVLKALAKEWRGPPPVGTTAPLEMFDRLPGNFDCWIKPRSHGEARDDRLIYGHPSGKPYKSIVQAGKHIMWLLRYQAGTTTLCTCELCTRCE